ncbi:F0F1 ATP synthase subunit B [Waterburya agarophytonicola K14]|uniref:ATP synthase subunit b n=1 Tax=Waterburya agarophytonicola KI4 TaxID=2874699 RepID=A0A964FF62_9CYAN|nr:F0F1 ATP synthase subunit B [Waterburya agarophytonicola]MCC0176576.1 F0F1 ATP synthase subunit B [Waterburya agarophytonicola KI4]
MIETLLFLAAAHSEVESGFGLNLNIFETNLINLTLLVGILVYFGKPVLTNVLSERRSKIAEQIKAVEQKQKQAEVTLAKEQKKLEEAQAIAAQIRSDATTNAQKARETILAQGEKEVQRLKEMAGKDLSSEQEKAIAQLRERVVALSLEKASSQIGTLLNDEAQRKLIDNSIAKLGGQ